jgi:hypothetical protein
MEKRNGRPEEEGVFPGLSAKRPNSPKIPVNPILFP